MNNTPDEFLTEYIQRTNLHQFDALIPLIDDDAVYWFSSGTHRGLSAIRAAFERTWSYIEHEVYAIENVEWLTVDSRTATCIYDFRWRGIIEGVIREGAGRGTNVLRKDGEKWRIVHEHLSVQPK
jgi:ketosteroid isomerase-like protein